VNKFEEWDRTELADIYTAFSLEFEDLCEIKYEFRLSTTEVLEGKVWITAQSLYNCYSKVSGMVSRYNF
jgi:hypothetical protein